MTNIEKVKKYIEEGKGENYMPLLVALINMRFEPFYLEDVVFFKDLYTLSKSPDVRNHILHSLVLRCLDYNLKDFFLSAFKRERYLDMRLTALRGYAHYASESEVLLCTDKFIEVLKKRAQTKPWNYQEYELLRSVFGLPYLVKTYGYVCFKEALAQLERQYEAMPDLCKGFFTLDEEGMVVRLMSEEETKANLQKLSKLS
ncbi:MAG: hypothetical protein LBR25_06730 [Erysipelotrichaceae bacterium]|jgi:hypothetical protein|nr:hypothetical protein [Erysipelotrichaceae bacterium]